ncbi:hypothetical protein BKA93DRAFT_119438 [Sparassis latifolia]
MPNGFLFLHVPCNMIPQTKGWVVDYCLAAGSLGKELVGKRVRIGVVSISMPLHWTRFLKEQLQHKAVTLYPGIRAWRRPTIFPVNISHTAINRVLSANGLHMYSTRQPLCDFRPERTSMHGQFPVLGCRPAVSSPRGKLCACIVTLMRPRRSDAAVERSCAYASAIGLQRRYAIIRLFFSSRTSSERSNYSSNRARSRVREVDLQPTNTLFLIT